MNTSGVGSADSVLALVDEVHFAFQPLINIKTGGVTAVEALARPSSQHVQDLFRQAARQRQLTDLDTSLAVAALNAASSHETLLPLHINVFGGSVTHALPDLDALRRKLAEIGRRETEVTLEICPPFARLDLKQLLRGIDKLRADGYQIALDGLGDGDVPLTLIGDMAPDMVKLDRSVVSAVPEDPRRTALLEALRHICEANDSVLVAEGVESERELTALRHNGVRMVQGNLLAPAARRPPTVMSVPGVAAEFTEPQGHVVSTTAAGPRVTEFLAPATMVPADITADQVRGVLSDHPDISAVVLVDEHNRPRWTIDRNRFLLAVTGPYGHALHATRPAARLADEPRIVTTTTTAMEALELTTSSDPYRMYDDAVVVDESGRCLGVVRAGHLIRGMAEMKVEEAAALNPLTRLPGSDAVARDVARRISAGEVFAVSWLDIDGFKNVNDVVGFSAGDELIRSVGRGLTDAATSLPSVRISHVGGDDFLLVADLDDLVPMSERILDPSRQVKDVDITLSLATIVCTQSTVQDYDEVSRLLAPLKDRAKNLRGSSWVMSRPGSNEIDVLRGHEESPVEDRPLRGRPVDGRPVDRHPVDSRPVDSRPVDSRPVDSRPVDSRPVDSHRVDPPPVADAPADGAPVDGGPVDAGPVDGGQDPAGPLTLPSQVGAEAVLGGSNQPDWPR